MRYALIAAVALFACEPTSATDHEAKRKQWRAAEGDEFFPGRARIRKMARIRQAFAERFIGKIKPGVGCDACPDMCKNADLRPISAESLLRLYRAAGMQYGHSKNDWEYQLAALELRRLACIAKSSDPEVQGAWLALLATSEDAAIRYVVAIQAIEFDVDTEAGWQTLQELAAETGEFATAAAIRIDERKLGIEPSF